MSGLWLTWPPYVLHTICTPACRQWQALLGVLAMARKVLLPVADLFALLSTSSVELLTLQSPSARTVELGVFTWSLLHLTLDLAWLSSIWSLRLAWPCWTPSQHGFALGFNNLMGVRLWTSSISLQMYPLAKWRDHTLLIGLWLTNNIYKMSSTVSNTKVFEWYLLLW